MACEEFSISVAFITMSGITPLLQTLKELENKGVKGRILTTDYLNFSEPKALKKLTKLKNIELRMYCSSETEEGFHTKGYIFKEDELYRIIVGSANMTLRALTKNKEWNTRIVSSDQGEYVNEILKEFQQLWDSEFSKGYQEFISEYSQKVTIQILEGLQVKHSDGNSGVSLKLLKPICSKYFEGMNFRQMESVVEQALAAWFEGKEAMVV